MCREREVRRAGAIASSSGAGDQSVRHATRIVDCRDFETGRSEQGGKAVVRRRNGKLISGYRPWQETYCKKMRPRCNRTAGLWNNAHADPD